MLLGVPLMPSQVSLLQEAPVTWSRLWWVRSGSSASRQQVNGCQQSLHLLSTMLHKRRKMGMEFSHSDKGPHRECRNDGWDQRTVLSLCSSPPALVTALSTPLRHLSQVQSMSILVHQALKVKAFFPKANPNGLHRKGFPPQLCGSCLLNWGLFQGVI